MPKKIIRIGLGGKVADVKPIFWAKSERQAIQDVFGKMLPKKAWIDIGIATALYQLAQSGEETAMPTAEFIISLQRLDKALKSARKSLSGTSPERVRLPKQHRTDLIENRRNGIRILNEIEERFFKLEKSNPSHQIDVMFYLLAHAIDALTAVSGWVQHEVSHPDYHGFKEGWAWEIWVVWLTIIMKEHGLPYKVSKATVNPNAKISPFVKFLWEFQATLPKELRRFYFSKDALAQGITRARSDRFLGKKFENVVPVEALLPGYRKLVSGG